ncbi:F-box/LRR-repeat protein 6-like [Microcaecilia unicolor]|uniref:F-box/LRR-repeat protein 6-like n=1 Tax=Microcaecilia unicolor TaxID=1415580 RepID=A0A6P7X388_9AMPH|nr:F-box/LRR-repeat protein 6-like [Microcaecilia unicolor]
MEKGRLRHSGPGKCVNRKRRRVHRSAPGLGYRVQETDADMLLVVRSGSPERESRPRSSRMRGEARKCPAVLRGDPGPWGEKLPVELLLRIFRLLVASEGAVPALCRASQVCRMWHIAAVDPLLWQDASLGFCWLEPGRKQLPQVEKKVRSTAQWLIENRFSLLRNFTLHHWKNNVSFIVKALSENCRHLSSLKLLHCSGVTTDCLLAVALRCPQLESLNLQNSQVDSSAVGVFWRLLVLGSDICG